MFNIRPSTAGGIGDGMGITPTRFGTEKYSERDSRLNGFTTPSAELFSVTDAAYTILITYNLRRDDNEKPVNASNAVFCFRDSGSDQERISRYHLMTTYDMNKTGKKKTQVRLDNERNHQGWNFITLKIT